MAFRAGLVNFSKGELAPELYSRADVAAYSAGVRKAFNVRILKYGGLTKRPGTRFVSEVLNAEHPVRLMPFQFDDGKHGQNYALEMGQGYMRPAADGGMVLEEELVVTAIQNAVHPIVAAAYHGYVPGDGVFFSGIGGMTELNFGVWGVDTVIDDHHFTLLQDTSNFGVFTGATGGIVRTGAPAAPTPVVVPPVVPPADPPPVTQFQFDPSVLAYIYSGAWFL